MLSIRTIYHRHDKLLEGLIECVFTGKQTRSQTCNQVLFELKENGKELGRLLSKKEESFAIKIKYKVTTMIQFIYVLVVSITNLLFSDTFFYFSTNICCHNTENNTHRHYFSLHEFLQKIIKHCFASFIHAHSFFQSVVLHHI